MVGNTERIIERTIYPEVVKELQQLGFQNGLGEAGEGTSRRATDVTFSYEGTKFLAEVKFGDINK